MKSLMGALVSVTLLTSFCAFTCAAQEQDKDKQDKDEAANRADKQIESKACPEHEGSHSTKTDKTTHPTPDAPADKAMIYVVRPTMIGNKVQSKLAVDGHWVGINRGDNYFYFTLEPGTHYFCS